MNTTWNSSQQTIHFTSTWAVSCLMLNPIWNILIKKNQKKPERNKTQEVLSEMYFKSRDKFNKNCPNYFKQNPFFLLWYCFIKVMKHINHYFVRTLVHKFLITHTIHVFFYYISSKENRSEHTCVISVTCSERWHPSNITRNKFRGKHLFQWIIR